MVDGALDIPLNQVGVDGDRRGRPGAGRRDHLRARIDNIARGPHISGAGPAGGVDSGEAGIVDLAAQTGQQTIGTGTLPGRMNTAVRSNT